MIRHDGTWTGRCARPLIAAVMMLGLTACGEGPGNPRPPLSPPRPTTTAENITKANLVLPARPVVAPPSML